MTLRAIATTDGGGLSQSAIEALITADKSTFDSVQEWTGNYTLKPSDRTKLQAMNKATTVNITFAEAPDQTYVVGDIYHYYQKGVGTLNLIAASGVTLKFPPGKSNSMAGQNAMGSAIFLGSNTFLMMGAFADA